MRLPNAVHESQPWRIRDIVPDFTLEDVWALPVHGGAEDFQTLLEIMTCGDDLINSASLPTRVLWRLRDRLGGWFGLGRISVPIDSGGDDAAGKLPIPGTNETSLTDRLPDDLRNNAADVHFDSVPFAPLYRTDVEFAAEMSNRTVHSVMHLAWVDRAKAATKDRWPSTSSHAVHSGRDTWRSSSRSGIGLFTQRSCERSNERGIDAFLGRPRSTATLSAHQRREVNGDVSILPPTLVGPWVAHFVARFVCAKARCSHTLHYCWPSLEWGTSIHRAAEKGCSRKSSFRHP
jgi:hypothetical protein